MLGLCCCVRAFSSCSELGLLFVAVHGLLTAVASLVAEHRFQARGLQQLQHAGSVVVARRPQSTWISVVAVCGLSSCGMQALQHVASVVVVRGLSSCGSRALECRLSSCGAWAQLLRGMWALPRPGIESVFPALAGGFLTTAP